MMTRAKTARRKAASDARAWRPHLVLGVMFTAFAVLAWRVVDLQIAERERLHAQGDARYLRVVNVAPQRGRILDRNGRVLGISTPVVSLTASPAQFCAEKHAWAPMLAMLDLTQAQLAAACARRQHADFMYVKRRLPPQLAEKVLALNINGLESRREYKRYYPAGPAGAHLLGFTDVDDVGQEGLELRFNSRLSGRGGVKRMLKDLHGRHVESVDSIRQVVHGEDLVLSIDQRIQALAGAYLEDAIKKHRASGGSVVVLSVPSGEILAMVNSPQFNPNARATLTFDAIRNRAVTDVFEPGSTVKPFTVAMALQSGKVDAHTTVDTSPGEYALGGRTIRDVKDYGVISLADVVIKSSNVGAAKVALAFAFDDLYATFQKLGFGQAGDLPGEVAGVLTRRERPIEHATFSYGYGLSVTSLQLARAYTVFATGGMLLPVTLEKKPPHYRAKGARVFSENTVQQLLPMLEQAASPAGTGRKAKVARYRIGGKTGTSHKLIDGNYAEARYQSKFVGIAPLSAPRYVSAIVVDDPRANGHFGGDVAAPIFSKLTRDLMRLYDIKPDQSSDLQTTSVKRGGSI